MEEDAFHGNKSAQIPAGPVQSDLYVQGAAESERGLLEKDVVI
jgi:hypothetical protein